MSMPVCQYYARHSVSSGVEEVSGAVMANEEKGRCTDAEIWPLSPRGLQLSAHIRNEWLYHKEGHHKLNRLFDRSFKQEKECPSNVIQLKVLWVLWNKNTKFQKYKPQLHSLPEEKAKEERPSVLPVNPVICLKAICASG